MARIHPDTVQQVKDKADIFDVVSDHVTLKRAGVGTFKGLCPFHDERTPSFNVNQSLGFYKCFGCGEAGDAISFLRAMNHLSFVEAVERLAEKFGIPVVYEDTANAQQDSGPKKTRLYKAHELAAEFYVSQLSSEEGQIAKNFMHGRGFDDAALADFRVGYAPRGWSNLANYLTQQGFQRDELIAAGLCGLGPQGLYDRFRGRVMWPIKDTSGQVVGFGARKLYEDDQGPKYLNTNETPIYHKSSVLYGIDKAKKTISKNKQVIIVEGYTDVMACHLAGVTNAIATSGTAFGAEHIAVIRRVLNDDPASEVIFTFDPDAAGQAAALKAFSQESKFRAQTYVALAPEGLDPSDLRQHRGDEAVRDIFKQKKPLFEFALSQTVRKFDLNSVEGRANALRESAPIVASIRDTALRPGYIRQLAGMLGEEVATVRHAVGSVKITKFESKQVISNPPQESNQTPHKQPENNQHTRPVELRSLPNNPDAHLERDTLMALLQMPQAVSKALFEQALSAHLRLEPFAIIMEAIARQPRTPDTKTWVENIASQVPPQLRSLVVELSVVPLRVRTENEAVRFATQTVSSLIDRDLRDVKEQLLRRMQRLPEDDVAARATISQQIATVEKARRAIIEQARD